jgi:hypothetical protein
MQMLVDAYRIPQAQSLVAAGYLEPDPVWDDTLGGPAWILTAEGLEAIQRYVER